MRLLSLGVNLNPSMAARLGHHQRVRALAIIITLLLALPASAAERSRAAVAAFKREHPCPATGKARGACPGFVVDHVKPLCAGGPDDPSNMQWQTKAAAKVKDRAERAQCRRR